MEAQENTFYHEKEFQLESGSSLPGFQLRYSTWGKLNADKSNVIWVCHALTGSSSFLDWWGGLFNEDGPFDPNEYFVICVNVLGGCYGSTGPTSINPKSKKPFFKTFPAITNNDVVRAFDLLRIHLGIEKIHTLIGGSLGGQQVLSWAIDQPAIFRNLIPIACNSFSSPWSIAINESQRMAIESDSSWQNERMNAGQDGLKAARAISMITFRSYDAFQEQEHENSHELDHFKAAAYQRYQGEKLAKRFDAHTYWTLTKMMDSHHVGRYYSLPELALAKIKANTLVIGINSDLLFPLPEQEFIARNINHAKLEVIDSPYGHDAFLIETTRLGEIIHQFLKAESNYVLR